MKKSLMRNEEKLSMLERYRLRPQKKGKVPNLPSQFPSIYYRPGKQNIQKIQFNLQMSKIGKKKQKYQMNHQICCQSQRKNQKYLQKKLSKILCQKLPKIQTQRNQYHLHQEVTPKLRYNQTKISPEIKKKRVKTKQKEHKKKFSENFHTQRNKMNTDPSYDLSVQQSQIFQNMMRAKNGYIKKGSKYRFYEAVNHIIKLGKLPQ